jgi:uncharacterized membrane-anchored protein
MSSDPSRTCCALRSMSRFNNKIATCPYQWIGRADLQSRLQRILEVISVVALTYYLAVLLTFILTAVKTAGVALNVELITGAATPFLFVIIWLVVRWTRKAVVRRYAKDPG